MAFTRAHRSQKKLRMAIDGPSGSGKSFTADRFAFAIGKKVAVVCTENGSAAAYADESPDGIPFVFDIIVLKNYAPTEYTAAIKEAGRLGYDVLIVDGLTQAWAGTGGALELKDAKGGNSFTAWKDITPMHNQMIEAILTSPCHVICTMRSKTEYVLEEEVDSNGRKKMVPRKVGMAPVQRPGMEYEFDVYCSMDWSHLLTVTKSRCSAMQDQKAIKPGPNFIAPLIHWLNSGEPSPLVVVPPEKPPEPSAAQLIYDDLLLQIHNCHDMNSLGVIAKRCNEEAKRLEKSHIESLSAEGKKASERIKAANNGKIETKTETKPEEKPSGETKTAV